MLISTLLAPWTRIPSVWDTIISDLTLDSRKIVKGNAFIALRGQTVDGKEYIEDAIKCGASLVLIEANSLQHEPFINNKVLHVPLQNLANLLPLLAERFYAVISSGIKLLGVTGTNGKTSCTHFLSDIYQQAGISCGIIGTLGSGLYGSLAVSTHTTPDILTLYKEINRLHQAGAKYIALEVSSHSIDQKRIEGLPFEVGIFTNLTQDHLDYHGDMESYANVKYQFLAQSLTKQVVINADDFYGKAWVKSLSNGHKLISFGIKEAERQHSNSPIIYAKEVKLLPHGIEASVYSPYGNGLLSIPLLGDFNLSNSLAVLSALLLEGWSLKELLLYFRQLKSVPGRMQAMGGDKHPLIVIDYAHTPDALEKALLSLRHHTAKRLICVFGCGGDRDRTKRSQMGRIASQLADLVILTNDNPRSEDPLAIIEEIKKGMTNHQGVTVISDRSKAIKNSIQYARSGDVVLIAGKGAERFQYIGDQVISFQDEEEVRHHLA